jgi:hypothetical protein
MHQAEKQLSADPRGLRLGGGCVIIGSLAVGGFRLAHGDLPAADAEAALAFITEHPMYAGVHLGTVFGALVWVAGFVALSGTLRHGFARALGRLGAASVLVGAAVFSFEHSVDGVAGQDLGVAWAAAAPEAQADLVLAAQTAFTVIRGPSLLAIVALWGLSLVSFGLAIIRENYPAWLGRTGVAVGALTVLGASALFLQEDLFPGVLLYGLLVSVVVQLWSLTLGILMWRRAGRESVPQV